jgi:ribonuclease P protein component
VLTLSNTQPFAGLPDFLSIAALGRRVHAMPAKKSARFPRTARLLRHADFERVYKQGRRHFSATMTVFYLSRPQAEASMLQEHSCPQGLRVGFTVGRVLGGAVQRNRMKRRLREAVRLSHALECASADVVINPKKSLLTVDFAEVVNEVSRAFQVIEQKLSQKSGTRKPETKTAADAANRP